MLLNTARPGRAQWPRLMGDAGIVVVAYLLGSTITAAMLLSIARELPGMLLASAAWVVVCFGIGIYFARASGIAQASSVLGTVPGGLSQMVSIADRFRQADAGTVAIMQTSRLIVVLYTVPVLATLAASSGDGALLEGAAAPAAGGGSALVSWPAYAVWLLLPCVPLSAWLFRRMGLAAGEFLGPVLVTGALAIIGLPLPEVPPMLIGAAQLCIGIYIGQRVNLRMLWSNKRLGPLALANAVLLVAAAAAAAWLLSLGTEPSAVTWFLALAPGGLGEVAVTALVLGADVAHVTAYQITRLFFVLLVAPPLIRLWLGTHDE